VPDEKGAEPDAPEGAASLDGVYSAALHHHAAGRLDEAERLYRQVVAADPQHARATHYLGVIAGQRGRVDLAAEMIGRAVRMEPSDAEAHNNLGAALRDLGRVDEAVACYRQAVALAPAYAEAHRNLGNALQERGTPDEAVACYRTAISLRADFADAYNDLGHALWLLGRLEEATICLRHAVALRPDFADAHNNLGNLLSKQGDWDAAIACFRTAIALRPDFAEAHNNIGYPLWERGLQEEAITFRRTAIALRPNYPEAYQNLAGSLGAQGHREQAVGCYRTAIALRPDYAEAHADLGLSLLAQGDLPAGWPEFEWRWKTQKLSRARHDFAQPQWRGEAAGGRALLIHAEQGFGDTLQFCRYVPLAAARGLRVVVQVPRPLVRLLRTLGGVDQLVAEGDDLPAFDLQCPMMSLPLAFGTTLATIPASIPYLYADAAQSDAWRTRLAMMVPEGLRVGLVWAGNPRVHQAGASSVDRRRSIAPDRLAGLVRLPSVHFFSLQKAGAVAPASFPLTDFMHEMHDFADTAALIANLDLVISVDTAVAHLAGALGKPVWLLDRHDACWRWLIGRGDSPWYPSLRIYRQPQPGDWDSVVARVADDLDRLASVF
jgi:tetratricopeptide (TPR) repeat protein